MCVQWPYYKDYGKEGYKVQLTFQIRVSNKNCRKGGIKEKPEGTENETCDIWKKGVLGRGNSKCTDAELGMLKKSKEASVSWAEDMAEKQ